MPELAGPAHLTYWTKHLDTAGFVYVIQARKGTPIKIGTALNVLARIAGLQTGNPEELRLLEVVPGDARLERHFHGRLRGDRVRGEWFYGPKVGHFLTYVADLAERMVQEHQQTGETPDYRSFIDLPGPKPKRPVYEVRTRRMEPEEQDDLVTDRDLSRFALDARLKQAERLSAAIRGA